jgi:hypothetical protein
MQCKTTDGEYVEFNTYNEAVKGLKKGLLSMKEINEYYGMTKELDKLVHKLLYNIRKISSNTKRRTYSIIDDYIHKEHVLSINLFKKYRQCLTLSEHIQVIKEVLKELPEVQERPSGFHTTEDEFEYYKGAMEHYRFHRR